MPSTLYSLDNLNQFDKKELIQELWSSYGEIVRLFKENGKGESLILKKIRPVFINHHPRGWNTTNSHKRKLRSYQVEIEFYKNWAKRCKEECKVPVYFDSSQTEGNLSLLIEDLNQAGYWKRRIGLSYKESKVVIRWLANFHATFMNEEPNGLWKEGTYWHLETRPDEYATLEDGNLKNKAHIIANRLKTTKCQTILHGDAKVANFCFTEDLSTVAAVDFQYVGGGCGIKDLAYFIGSCLKAKQCETHESQILELYFSELKSALKSIDSTIDFTALEQEWRSLYAFAWADFSRFLMGWSPGHQKLNYYALIKTKEVLQSL